MSEHLDLEGAIAAYVLGAAEPEEREEVRNHLAGCAECREIAKRLQVAADALPLAAELVKPPARLRARIMEAAAASPHTGALPPARAKVLSLPRRERNWNSARLAPYWSQAAVAALAIAVVGLGAWNLSLGRQVETYRSQAHVYRSTIDGQGPMTGSQAKVVDLRSQGVALVSFSHMPTVSADKVYELWLINDKGTPEPGGVFRPDPDGTKILVLQKDLRGYRAIAVTIEQGPDGALTPSAPSAFSGPVL